MEQIRRLSPDMIGDVLRRLNIVSDGADVMCNGKWETVQTFVPETEKARLPVVERLNGGTASWLEEAHRNLRDGRDIR